MSETNVLPEAEPMSVEGNSVGVLVVHGFTGNPSSMRPIAEACAAAGYSVEMPRLPGHGTTVADMKTTGWADWSGEAERALTALAARTSKQVVVGLSMGGTLTVWLATRHPELAAVVTVNPAVVCNDDLMALVQTTVDGGTDEFPSIGSDIAAEGVSESSYAATPLVPLLSMLTAAKELMPNVGTASMPMLLMTSPQDHVVPPTDSDWLAEHWGGSVERVTLERSFHVATLDHDGPLIIERVLAHIATHTS
jgi:carboxylesterase